MIFISLGRHCNSAYHIKKYKNQEMTLFFDNLRTDFKCVLGILSVKNIDDILNINNLNVDKKTYDYENCTSITFKNFDEKNLLLLSHHDIRIKDCNDIELSDTEMNLQLINFIEKYRRRYYRLIDNIMHSNSENPIVFIYKVTDDKLDFDVDIINFIQVIKSLNKEALFCLVTLVYTNEDYIFVKYNDYLKINLTALTDPTIIKKDWKEPEVNWQEVFNIIDKNAF
jgi:hypothetical protein